jgi:hypothetical protein
MLGALLSLVDPSLLGVLLGVIGLQLGVALVVVELAGVGIGVVGLAGAGLGEIGLGGVGLEAVVELGIRIWEGC